MYSLRSVDVMSCAKMMGAIYGGLVLIVAPFFLLGGIGSLIFGHGSPSAGIGMLFFAILAPILYGAIGFVVGALMAWVYNLVAQWIGGIELELKPVAGNTKSNLGLI